MDLFVGASPYCYANTVAMVLDAQAPPVALFETLTASPFGFQLVGGVVPLFDPQGWDPDQGTMQALQLLGWTSARETFPDAGAALARLRELCAEGPVFVGPLEMGLLRHQPGNNRPIGADHFVAVLEVDDDTVTFHDPQGFPWTRLPRAVFTAAWGADSIAYGQGAFPLRSTFVRAEDVSAEQAVDRLLPLALDWARGRPTPYPGGAEGLQALAALTKAALPEPTRSVLTQFSLRLGARRRTDAAVVLSRYPDVASTLRSQARLLGAAQYQATTDDAHGLVCTFEELAELHQALITRLERAA